MCLSPVYLFFVLFDLFVSTSSFTPLLLILTQINPFFRSTPFVATTIYNYVIICATMGIVLWSLDDPEAFTAAAVGEVLVPFWN